MRNTYLLEHPLCEACLYAGKITSAEDIHHKTTFIGANSETEMNDIAFDYDNLQSLCKEHHSLLHTLDEFKNRKIKDGIELIDWLNKNKDERDLEKN